MGFADSLKKVIGIEEIEDDEIVTEEELKAERERLAKEEKKAESEKVQNVSSYEDLAIEPKAQTEKKPFFSGLSNNSTGAAAATSGGVVSSRTAEKKFSVTNTSSLKLILIEPRSFDECPKLVDSLKARKPVIINLERLETEVARKIFDFLSGATYALDGNVQKIANNIFIFTPENVSVAAAQNRNTVAEAEEKSTPWR